MADAGKTKKANRTRHEKFIELAEKRTDLIRDRLRVLGNLADRRTYEYTESEVLEMFEAIDDAMKASKKRFMKGLKYQERDVKEPFRFSKTGDD